MSNVAPIRPDVQRIAAPSALRKLPGWLVWRYEQKPGEPKPRKVPYYAAGGRRIGVQGRPEDRQQLVPFDVAAAAAARRGFDGVGLALLPDFGVVALDFDNCVLDGHVMQEVENVVGGTYAELSPSGNGVRAFLLGDLGNRKSPAQGNAFGFETFSSKGFVTYTGNPLDTTWLLGASDTVTSVPDAVWALYHDRFGRGPTAQSAEAPEDPLMAYEPRLGISRVQLDEALDVLDPDMGHDRWLRVGMGIHHELDGDGFELWDAWSAKGGKYPGTEALRKRWESFGRQSARPVTSRYVVRLANENGARIALGQTSPEEFGDSTPGEPEVKLRFRVVPGGEFSRGPRPGWIVKGVLPKAEVVVLFGESGSGKSFVALDLCMAVARGVEWRGHKVKQGRVVYLAAEGGGGFRNRLAAYEIHNGVSLDLLPFGVLQAAPNFLQKADVVDVARAVVAFGPTDVVVVDTFAQVTAGANENAAEDVGRALAHCRGIHRATGAVVVLVHHAGKDLTKGARGWSGLRAAADAEIEVGRTPAGRYLRISKQKDAEDGREYGFGLQVVPIGVDEDGDIVDSCVVVAAEMPATGKADRRRPAGVWERLIGEVVAEMSLAQSEGIEVGAVVEEVVRRGPEHGGAGRDQRRGNVNKALKRMAEAEDVPFYVQDGCIVAC